MPSSTYTLRFIGKDGSVLETRTNVPAGGISIPPRPPVIPGYTFSGWIGNYRHVQKSADVRAVYTANAVYICKLVNGVKQWVPYQTY